MRKSIAKTWVSMFVVMAVLVLKSSGAWADATLSITPVDEVAAPKVVLISNATTQRRTTATFTVTLAVPPHGEARLHKVLNQVYTLTYTGGKFDSSEDVTVTGNGTFDVCQTGDNVITISKYAIADENGDYDWAENSDGNITVTASVFATTNSAAEKDKTLELSGSATYVGEDGNNATVTNNPNGLIKFTAVKVTVENPTGDPRESLQAAKDVNEFTYDDTRQWNEARCEISCRAKLEPDTPGTVKWAEDNISWSAEFAGSTGKLWIANHAQGVVEGNNYGKDVTLRLIGLSEDNSGFGVKSIVMNGAQDGDIDALVEIFFSRDATNHPGGNQTPYLTGSPRSPNWFYYWNKAIGDDHVLFNGNANDTNEWGPGQVPAMTNWTNDNPPGGHPKDEIWIHNFLSGGYRRRDGTNAYAYGIDYFANVLAHERKHVSQIAGADALLNNHTGMWLGGWAWRFTDNRFNMTTPNLGDLDVNDDYWPDLWTLPVHHVANTNHIEADAQNQETVADNTHWESDFGDMGKRHLMNRTWND